MDICLLSIQIIIIIIIVVVVVVVVVVVGSLFMEQVFITTTHDGRGF
jgi:hypothetical protein